MVRDVVAAYEKALGDVQDELEDVAAGIVDEDRLPEEERARLERLRDRLDAKVREAREVMRDRIAEELTTTAQTEGGAVLNAMKQATPEVVHVLFGEVPEAQVVRALTTPIGVRVWSDRLDLGLLEVRDNVRREVAAALARGASMEKAAEGIRAAAGYVEAYRGQAVSIARTEIQRVANDVAHSTYRENLDVLKGVTRLATLDTRTCLVCAPLHMVTWYYDEAGNLLDDPEHGPHRTPPLHPRCRCFDAPLTKSWAELGLPVGLSRRDRERLDGSLPQNMDYPAWFKRQPQVRQVEILGPGRYRLWRSGKVKLGDFADTQRVLRLDELPA